MMILAWMVGIIDTFMLLYVMFSNKVDGSARLVGAIMFLPSIFLALKVMGWL